MNARIVSWSSVRSGMALVAVAALPAVEQAHGQGRDGYFNVESIQCSPITTARIDGHDYILACNTPDNSVEVWDTDESLPAAQRFVERIPVGALEPVSIVWDSTRDRFTVASFLSDSLTTGTITAVGGPSNLVATVDKVANVGDEPIDLTLTPDNTTLLVTFNTSSAVGFFDAVTLDPVPPSTSAGNLLLLDTSTDPDRVVKEPHAVAARGDQLFVLGFKGGRSSVLGSEDYDLDLYACDLSDPQDPGGVVGIGGLGSTNWNMAFAANGDLYVVGAMAQNHLIGDQVATALTGFVTTNLYRVTGAGTSTPTIVDRDLNLRVANKAFKKSKALTMATDVIVYETPSGETKVFVAAFGSDRVGVVTNTGALTPLDWNIARIPIAPVGSSERSGPRGLALTPDDGSPSTDDRLYVLNRLDGSISIVNPNTDKLIETFSLDHDPTPAYITDGREFLYSADLSRSGFVSCASCHTDGRTDALAWNLGSKGGFSADFTLDFVDSPSGIAQVDIDDGSVKTTDDYVDAGFDADKGPLVTQTLQGLLNFEVEPGTREAVTNAPYHWRGDRARFTDFNEGFTGLLGRQDIGTPEAPAGIPEADMLAFEEFVGSINHGPNPKQPKERVYSGSFGTFDDKEDGSGALRGLKNFHIQRIPGGGTNGRSCVQCHSLPIGSNSRWTVFEDVPEQLESAQLRGLFQREGRYQVDAGDSSDRRSGMFGLSHAGLGRPSINSFLTIFSAPLGNRRDDVAQYLHEFDFGVAPMVGRVQTLTTSSTPDELGRLDAFEAQADLANCGVAVLGHANGSPLHYRYDPVSGMYAEEPPGATITRSALLALLSSSGDRLFAVCTPLGSTRRVASEDGDPDPLPVATPTNLVLEPMSPNTANAEIPTLIGNWTPGSPPSPDFFWSHSFGLPTPRFLLALRQFQWGLIRGGSFGITALRHDAPRRLRVSGDGILEGAKLHLYSPADPNAAPDRSGPPDPAKVVKRTFDLFPTDQVTGAPVWETAVELAPIVYYAMMNGGDEAPGVAVTLDDVWSQEDDVGEVNVFGQFVNPNPFDPAGYNWHYVEVENPDGTTGNGGWAPLTMAP